MEIDQTLPAITFTATDPSLKSFQDFKGHNLVIYFYPKDNTPGCTLEGKDFKTSFKQFTQLNTKIIGVSRDTLSSHQKFISKLGLPYPLIADTDEKVCKAFQVLAEKNLFGMNIFGVQRSTFLVDEKGIVRHVWRKISAKGHVEEVLAQVKKLM